MKTLKSILLITFVAIAFAACDSNPVDEDGENHEHQLSDIHRLALVMSGEEVVVYENNVVVGGAVDTLRLHEGEESALITLEATTEDGDEIHLDELGDEYSLSYDQELLDPAVAAFEQHDGERWSFHLHGEGAGATELSLWFMHIDHADYKSAPLPVEVVEGEHAADDHDHE